MIFARKEREREREGVDVSEDKKATYIYTHKYVNIKTQVGILFKFYLNNKITKRHNEGK